ncbi:hypothetical protein U1Q18_025099, partial [Sarracenia purpurea var. burkii]
MQDQNPNPMDSLMQQPTSIQDVQKKSFRVILLQPRIKAKLFDSDVKNLSEDEMLDEAQESSATIDQELSKANNGASIMVIPKKLIMRARQQWMDCLILKLLGKSIGSPSKEDSSVQLSSSDIKVDPAEVEIGDSNKGVGEETAFGSFNLELINFDDPKIERENNNTGPASKEGNTAEVILPSIASEEVRTFKKVAGTDEAVPRDEVDVVPKVPEIDSEAKARENK